jgi:hypothetical protein
VRRSWGVGTDYEAPSQSRHNAQRLRRRNSLAANWSRWLAPADVLGRGQFRGAESARLPRVAERAEYLGFVASPHVRFGLPIAAWPKVALPNQPKHSLARPDFASLQPACVEKAGIYIPAPPVRGGLLGHGGMAEWLKAHAWKACIRATVSWVRIPLPPPTQRCAGRKGDWDLCGRDA